MASALAIWNPMIPTEQEDPLYSVPSGLPLKNHSHTYLLGFFQYKLAKYFHSFNVSPLEHSGIYF